MGEDTELFSTDLTASVFPSEVLQISGRKSSPHLLKINLYVWEYFYLNLY